jgi:hypothetical protein
MSFDFGSELLSAALGALVGYVSKYGFDKARQMLVRDRLMIKAWHFLQEPTQILVPLVDATDVGAAGGFGDLLAMADVVTLAKTYFPSAMSLAVQAVQSDSEEYYLEDNLVVIGGGKYNGVYRDLIGKLAVPLHSFDTAMESLKEMRNKERSIAYSPEYDADGRVTHDVGLLVRARNPYESSKWVVLAAGCHTYGTAAAMQYLTNVETLQDISRHLNHNLEIIVRARIENHAISDIRRVSRRLTW